MLPRNHYAHSIDTANGIKRGQSSEHLNAK